MCAQREEKGEGEKEKGKREEEDGRCSEKTGPPPLPSPLPYTRMMSHPKNVTAGKGRRGRNGYGRGWRMGETSLAIDFCGKSIGNTHSWHFWQQARSVDNWLNGGYNCHYGSAFSVGLQVFLFSSNFTPTVNTC